MAEQPAAGLSGTASWNAGEVWKNHWPSLEIEGNEVDDEDLEDRDGCLDGDDDDDRCVNIDLDCAVEIHAMIHCADGYGCGQSRGIAAIGDGMTALGL